MSHRDQQFYSKHGKYNHKLLFIKKLLDQATGTRIRKGHFIYYQKMKLETTSNSPEVLKDLYIWQQPYCEKFANNKAN